MNINSLGAIKNYQKLDSLNSSRVKSADVNRQNPSSEKTANKDTVSFSYSAKETKDYNLKLEGIKRQLSEGTYKLDPDAVASKILGGLYL